MLVPLFFGSVFVCLFPAWRGPPSPSVGPLWRLGPGFTGPSLWVSLLPATAWLPCLCAWSVVAHCLPSSLCLMATKAFGPVWGSFPLHMLPVLLGCCVLPHWGIHHCMIRGPFLDTAKARSYPFWCVCVTFSLCPLLPPGSSPLFFCVVRGVVCVVLWPPPSFCFPPLMAGFLLVGCVLFFSSFAWIPRIPPYIIALSFHPGYIGLMFLWLRIRPRRGCFLLPPPSFLIHVDFVCFLLWLLLRLRIGEGPSPLCCFCLCSERGGRFPVEPWTRLHCSELYWRCPVELPVVQTGAPACSKACPHGSLCGCSVVFGRWPTRWESGLVWNTLLTYGASGSLRRHLLGRWRRVTPVRESGTGAANHFNLHSLGGRVQLQCECNFCLHFGSSTLVVLTSPCYGQ